MNTWMYVIREFEDAIDDCSTSSIDNNYDAAHAWDEGVAFWTGSLEGTDGSGSGKMIAALADKRCQNFGTCGASGSATSGIAKANIDFFALSAEARDYLYSGQCSLVRPVLTEVIKKMAIPLILGPSATPTRWRPTDRAAATPTLPARTPSSPRILWARSLLTRSSR